MTYIMLYLTPRLAIAICIAGVLTADTVWLGAERDSDFVSRVNPWVTLVISIFVMLWGILPIKYGHYFNDAIWCAHGWWVFLFIRLTFHPEPAQVDGWDRVSWIFVYFSMAVLTLGVWFAARRKSREPFI